MFRFVVLLIVSFISAPVFAQASYVALAAKAKATVVHDLKDPDSAKFRGIGIYKSTTGKGGVTVCGEVNAKNAFGAYVGYKRFMLFDDIALMEGQDSTGLTYEMLGPVLCYEKVAAAK